MTTSQANEMFDVDDELRRLHQVSLIPQTALRGSQSPSIALPTKAMQVAQGRQSGRDWQPAIAPREILLAPLWHDARVAARHNVSRILYDMSDNGRRCQYVTQTANPISQNNQGLEGRKDPSGLLRYLDLDILMALSYEYCRTGQPRITTSQRLLLHIMGYSNIDAAPFRELRASVQRMAATAIVTNDAAAPPDELAPWKLIALNSIETGNRGKGRLGVLDAALSSEWIAATQIAWQVFDMRGYVHLCRSARHNGLARVLYLFFAGIADHRNNEFRCPLSWLQQRYADRRGGPGGKYNFTNPLNPKGRLFTAIRLLTELNVIKVHDVIGNPNTPDKVLLRGSFTAASNLPRIPEIEPDRHQQQVLFSIDKISGDTYLEHENQLSSDVNISVSVDTSLPLHEEPPKEVLFSARTPTPDDSTFSEDNERIREQQKSVNSEQAIINHLRPLIRVNRKAETEAEKQGWSPPEIIRLYLVALYRKYKNEVPRPGGWAASIMRTGWSQDWERDNLRTQYNIQEIKTWAYGPQGPLAKFANQRRETKE